MPRNGSGTFTVVNSFSPDTTILSSEANANFTDVGSEITNSLPRDGQASMTGQFKAAVGTVALPGMAFGSDTDTGLYRAAADTIGVAVGGVQIASVSSLGVKAVSGDFLDNDGIAIAATPTGAMIDYVSTTAPSGWVRANGRTIGDASSGASERANADTSSLFSLLWASFDNSILAIQDISGSASTRGVSAAVDYAAHKRMPLPDLRSRVSAGLDDMGNSAAGRLGSVISSPTTNGQSGGAETTTLTTSQIPSHSHAVGTLATASDGAHHHLSFKSANSGSAVLSTTYPTVQGVATGGGYTIGGSASAADVGLTSDNGAHTHALSGSTATAGSGTAHSNVQPTWLCTKIIKL